MKSTYMWQGSKVQRSGSDRCQRSNSLAPLDPWAPLLWRWHRNNLPCGKAKHQAWHSVANLNYVEGSGGGRRRVGGWQRCRYKGSWPDCLLYLFSDTNVNWMQREHMICIVFWRTQKEAWDPHSRSYRCWGGNAVSGHSSLPVLCIHSGLIFNEDCRRTGTSLKRAILRLSCLPLNLTADLSHYLLSSPLRRWGRAEFEKVTFGLQDASTTWCA